MTNKKVMTTRELNKCLKTINLIKEYYDLEILTSTPIVVWRQRLIGIINEALGIDEKTFNAYCEAVEKERTKTNE